MSARRHRLLADVLPKFEISRDLISKPPLDARVLFTPRPTEIWLEIGFGKGEHLAAQAKTHPKIGFIGCEPFINGVAGLVTKIHEEDLKNIRIYPDDARPLIDALPDGSIGRVFLLHPDPWPKARHAKRRFVSTSNLDRLSRVMSPGAELRIGTDHPGYMAWTMTVMQGRDDFIWTAEKANDWRLPPAGWPETRYAAKAKAAKPVYLSFKKTSQKA